MTTKKMYAKPSMKVVPLRQKPQLLVGSAKRGQMDDPEDYSQEDDPFNF